MRRRVFIMSATKTAIGVLGGAAAWALSPFTGGASLAAAAAAGAVLNNLEGEADREKARKEGFKDGYQKCSTDTIDKLSNHIRENQ